VKDKQPEAVHRAEEERIAAEKLATKREEQRRRNREWNNREQVRHQQEANAKVTKAAELRERVEANRISSGLLPGSGVVPVLPVGVRVAAPQLVTAAASLNGAKLPLPPQPSTALKAPPTRSAKPVLPTIRIVSRGDPLVVMTLSTMPGPAESRLDEESIP
jgi:hypothetical protein